MENAHSTTTFEHTHTSDRAAGRECNTWTYCSHTNCSHTAACPMQVKSCAQNVHICHRCSLAGICATHWFAV